MYRYMIVYQHDTRPCRPKKACLLACVLVSLWQWFFVSLYVCKYTSTNTCIDASLHLCMYVCMYVGSYGHMYVYMYVCMYVCIQVCMNTCMCLYVCMRARMYACKHVSMYVCHTCTRMCLCMPTAPRPPPSPHPPHIAAGPSAHLWTTNSLRITIKVLEFQAYLVRLVSLLHYAAIRQVSDAHEQVQSYLSVDKTLWTE